jgi:hypothetical protein
MLLLRDKELAEAEYAKERAARELLERELQLAHQVERSI